VPQIWTYERGASGAKSSRAFVWMQGHLYDNMSNYQIEAMLLRAIAWAGHRPADELTGYKDAAPAPGVMEQSPPPPRPAGAVAPTPRAQ
jgi:hypothetical protein